MAGRIHLAGFGCEQVHSHVRIGSRKWKQAGCPDETPRNVRVANGGPVIAPCTGASMPN
jgi:hypothetical protein